MVDIYWMCDFCARSNHSVEKRVFKNGSIHLEKICGQCGKHNQWMCASEIPEALLAKVSFKKETGTLEMDLEG